MEKMRLGWSNRMMEWALRSPFQFLFPGTMLIEFKGRKSQKQYAVPVSYLRDQESFYTVSFRHRTWWRNLVGGAPVTLRLKGRDVKGIAHVLIEPSAVEQGLAACIRIAPMRARFYGVALDSNGEVHRDQLASAAQTRIIVQTRLAECSPRR
jgi:hypothetical protein